MKSFDLTSLQTFLAVFSALAAADAQDFMVKFNVPHTVAEISLYDRACRNSFHFGIEVGVINYFNPDQLARLEYAKARKGLLTIPL